MCKWAVCCFLAVSLCFANPKVESQEICDLDTYLRSAYYSLNTQSWEEIRHPFQVTTYSIALAYEALIFRWSHMLESRYGTLGAKLFYISIVHNHDRPISTFELTEELAFDGLCLPSISAILATRKMRTRVIERLGIVREHLRGIDPKQTFKRNLARSREFHLREAMGNVYARWFHMKFTTVTGKTGWAGVRTHLLTLVENVESERVRPILFLQNDFGFRNDEFKKGWALVVHIETMDEEEGAFLPRGQTGGALAIPKDIAQRMLDDLERFIQDHQ